MRKVELLPTRDCEAGYRPDDFLHLSSFSCSFSHYSLIFLRFLPRPPGKALATPLLEYIILFILITKQSSVKFFSAKSKWSLFGQNVVTWKIMFRHFPNRTFFSSADYNVLEKFWYVSSLVFWVKGCGIVLVSHCFRENVVVIWKIGSLLCSLDNLLQKKRNCFLLWKSNFKMALIWKKGYFWPTFHIV